MLVSFQRVALSDQNSNQDMQNKMIDEMKAAFTARLEKEHTKLIELRQEFKAEKK